jgi:uncharacterized protein (DUF983 family)
MAVTWWQAGLSSRCPNCGKGELFERFLAFRPACPACGTSFADADAGDGASVFVTLAAGIIVVPLAFILLFAVKLSVWLVLPVMAVVTVAVVVALLRPFKATLYALQRHHKAGDARY